MIKIRVWQAAAPALADATERGFHPLMVYVIIEFTEGSNSAKPGNGGRLDKVIAVEWVTFSIVGVF